MLRIIFSLNFLLWVFCPTASSAWGFQGHRIVGSIADQLLNPRAKLQVATILGFELRIAGPWADCVKSVVRNDDGTFEYKENPNHPEYEIPCTSFRTSGEQKRMEDYVGRNWTQCVYPPTGQERGCHNTYHFDDIAIERDRFDRGFLGTSEHDLVAAVSAAISVLKDRPATAPFSIADKKEALFMLSHFLGDLHQPLHVAAVYLDTHGHLVDPDAVHRIDPSTDTVGGNNIRDQHTPFHTEWDAIPDDLGEAATPALLSAARSTPPSGGVVEDWPALWASDTVAVAHYAFEGANFKFVSPQHWTVAFDDRNAYLAAQDSIKRRQLAKAGARLAELLNAIWP
ncbi:S1/P1 nuclease [Bradyrhizobium rifense]|nr:S1/P1 nuclease [Bradyrhizobium rifense]